MWTLKIGLSFIKNLGSLVTWEINRTQFEVRLKDKDFYIEPSRLNNYFFTSIYFTWMEKVGWE